MTTSLFKNKRQSHDLIKLNSNRNVLETLVTARKPEIRREPLNQTSQASFIQNFSPRPTNFSFMGDADLLNKTSSTFGKRSASIAVPKLDKGRYNESTGLFPGKTSALEIGSLPKIVSKGKAFLSPPSNSHFRSGFFGSQREIQNMSLTHRN